LLGFTGFGVYVTKVFIFFVLAFFINFFLDTIGLFTTMTIGSLVLESVYEDFDLDVRHFVLL